MSDRIEEIFSQAKRLTLTADEKSAGREVLRSYMALTPMRVEATVQTAKKPGFGFVRAWTGRTAAAFSVSLAVLLSAGSVSYAAEGALPGDLLYPVKVGVNEEVHAALSVSAQAKASWNAERAERRLAEAEALSSRGRLRAETRTQLEAQFRSHAKHAHEGIAALEESSDIEAAADVNAHLEGSLRAHKKIIAMLAEDESSGLGASVDHEIAESEAARGKNEARVAAEATPEAKNAAEGRRGAAMKKIAEVRAYLAAKHAKRGAEATAEAEARLADADATIAEANAKLAAGENSAAFALFAKAQREAQEAKLLVRADHELKIKAGGARINAAVNANVNAAVNVGNERRDDKNDGSSDGSRTDGEDDRRGNGRQGDIKLDVGSGWNGAQGEAEAKLGL